MDFPNQAHGNGKCRQLLQPVVHGAHIVDHFSHIARPFRRQNLRFRRQQVLQRTLRPFDLAGKHRLFAHIHQHEQVGVGQCLDGTIQSPQRKIGLGQQFLEVAGQLHGRLRRQRRGDEGAIARRLHPVFPGAGAHGRRWVICVHVILQRSHGRFAYDR
ncbi:MAG: hypothetical protein BWY63_02251 [Chloroflexi bacterium ADurb.Bin360]|nr:MAG: hypothetical protein BWY63_02251 [Chloroflexi bacterium ADurb.Bin360]